MDIPKDVTIEFDPVCFTRVGLGAVQSYWDSKRRARSMPSRADIRPDELKDWLSQLLLVDVIDGGAEFRYRLLGTKLTAFFPEDATNKTFSEALKAFGPVTVEQTKNVYKTVIDRRRPALVKGPGYYFRQDSKAFQAILTPLSDDNKNVSMIFGAFEFEWPKER